jgi:hypothetical protein
MEGRKHKVLSPALGCTKLKCWGREGYTAKECWENGGERGKPRVWYPRDELRRKK